MIVVQRIGGGNDASDAPVDDALVQIDCWGKLEASGNGLKAGATALVTRCDLLWTTSAHARNWHPVSTPSGSTSTRSSGRQTPPTTDPDTS
jgi:hypothetical protein